MQITYLFIMQKTDLAPLHGAAAAPVQTAITGAACQPLAKDLRHCCRIINQHLIDESSRSP